MTNVYGTDVICHGLFCLNKLGSKKKKKQIGHTGACFVHPETSISYLLKAAQHLQRGERVLLWPLRDLWRRWRKDQCINTVSHRFLNHSSSSDSGLELLVPTALDFPCLQTFRPARGLTRAGSTPAYYYKAPRAEGQGWFFNFFFFLLPELSHQIKFRLVLALSEVPNNCWRETGIRVCSHYREVV